MAHFHALQEHAIEGDEHGDLYHHRQTTRERIYFFLFVQVHHGPAQFLAVVLEGFLNLLHPWTHGAHFGHGTAAGLAQGIEQQFDQCRHDDDRPAPVADQLVHIVEPGKERLGQHGQDTEVDGALEIPAERRELRLQFRAHE